MKGPIGIHVHAYIKYQINSYSTFMYVNDIYDCLLFCRLYQQSLIGTGVLFLLCFITYMKGPIGIHVHAYIKYQINSYSTFMYVNDIYDCLLFCRLYQQSLIGTGVLLEI